VIFYHVIRVRSAASDLALIRWLQGGARRLSFDDKSHEMFIASTSMCDPFSAGELLFLPFRPFLDLTLSRFQSIS